MVRFKPSARGGDDADLGHGIHHPLKDGGSGCHDTRGESERAR